MKTDRRAFIKYASALLGGSILAACSDQAGPLAERMEEQGMRLATANAYKFYTLKRDGDALPDGRQIDSLRYDAVISDNGQIAYTAFDQEGRLGLYRLQVDTTGATPRVIDERLVIREEAPLGNGYAAPAGGYHITANGDVIIALETLVGEGVPDEAIAPHVQVEYAESDGFGLDVPPLLDPDKAYRRESAIYRMTPAGEVETLVASGVTIEGGHVIDGNFGPAVTAGHELLFTAVVSFYNPQSDTYERIQGLLYLEDIRTGAEKAVLVQRSGSLPYGMFVADEINSESVVQVFGLLDLQPGGRYCVQAHTALPNRMNDAYRPEGEQSYLGSLLMTGNARQPGSAVVLAAPAELGITPANRRDRVGIGMAMHGPRIGPNGVMGSVLTLNNDQQRLYYGGRHVASTGDITPGGAEIGSFMTPAFGPEGEMFITVQAESSMELMMFDGVEFRTVLRTNDTLVGETTPVGLITLGTLIRHINRDAQLAFTVVRDDGSTALVIGIPA